MASVLGNKYSRKYCPPLCAIVLPSVEEHILIQKYKYVKEYHLQNIDPIFEKKNLTSLDDCTRLLTIFPISYQYLEPMLRGDAETLPNLEKEGSAGGLHQGGG